MKVKELKEWLKKFDENYEVIAFDYEGDGFIEIRKNEDEWLHPEGVLEIVRD